MQADQQTQDPDLTTPVTELADPAARLTGRAAVRFYFLAPLAGLPRKRGVTLVAHDKALAGLVDKLAYMTPRNLAGLAELVLRQAGLVKGGPCWPDPAVVRSWAMRLQVLPPQSSPYVRSVMTCEMGRRARDQGWLVELYQEVKRDRPPPPNTYSQAKLREKAEENRRQRDRVREWVLAGKATPDERRWLDRWTADLAEAEAMLADAERVKEGVVV